MFFAKTRESAKLAFTGFDPKGDSRSLPTVHFHLDDFEILDTDIHLTLDPSEARDLWIGLGHAIEDAGVKLP